MVFLASFTSAEPHRSRRPPAPKLDLSKFSVPLSNGTYFLPSISSIFGRFRDSVVFLSLYHRFPLFRFGNYRLLTFHAGSASLPAPDGLKIKAITVGRGTQNYSCAAGSTAPPVQVGAVATLFDVSPLLPFLPISEGDDILALLPNYFINFPSSALETSAIPVIGYHHFDASGVPVFDLGQTGLFRARRTNSIGAPKGASQGTANQSNGAIDWLELCAVEGSKDITKAYRVVTAGGKPPKLCTGEPTHIEVEYATHYWFLQ